MSTSLTERALTLMAHVTNKQRKFKQLEEVTAIPADRWSALSLGRQRPTAEMIEALARAWPEHAFWLVTGMTDNEFSHTAPDQSNVLDVACEPRPAGRDFLRLRSQLMKTSTTESSSWVDQWEDWLTDHQERNSKRFPWLYSVHPKLAERKERKEAENAARAERIRLLAAEVDAARKKRLAEFMTIQNELRTNSTNGD